MVYTTAHVCIGIISVSFEYIIDCIICTECDLDIGVLEKICEISYHWVVHVKVTHFLGLEGVLLCECGKVIFELSVH